MPAASSLRRLGAGLNDRPWLLAFLTAFLSAAVIILRFRLWQFDLHAPLAYRQDALHFQVMVKALGEGAWNDHIAQLGAPFGLEAVDFPIRCSLDYTVMKLLMLLFHNPFFVVNLYWLLATALAGANAALFLRFLRVGAVASITFGVLFAIIPFVFFRSVAHLDLVTYLVPGGAFLAVLVARGDILDRWRARSDTPRNLIVPLVVCLAIGFAYAYWAFFTCLLVALAGLIGFLRQRRPRILLGAGIVISLLCLSALINLAPVFLYWHQHGRNPDLAYKSASDADTYGLRLRQMLSPVLSNGIPWLQRVREKIVAAGFPEDAKDANESVSAALGTVGSVGFLLLIVIAFSRGSPPASVPWGDTPKLLSLLTLALILVAHTGGLGGLFNIFVTNEFRCYNRVSPYISLFAFTLLAMLFDRVLTKTPILAQLAISCGLITFAAFDQIPLYYLSFHRAIEREFREDAITFRAIEARLPPRAMIFQLPYMPYPLDSGVQRLPYYENAKGYLQSASLHWSWGEMMGRHGNWNEATAALPAKLMLERIAYAGFSGIVIGRRGYADTKLEDELAALTEARPLVSQDGRWSFYDIRSYVEKMRSGLTADDWARRGQEAKSPPLLR